MLNKLKSILEKRILVLDGAMGTMIQQYQLEEKDYLENPPPYYAFSSRLEAITCYENRAIYYTLERVMDILNEEDKEKIKEWKKDIEK